MEDAIDEWIIRQINWLRREDFIVQVIRWIQDVRILSFSFTRFRFSFLFHFEISIFHITFWCVCVSVGWGALFVIYAVQ